MFQHINLSPTALRLFRAGAAAVFGVTGIVNDEPIACLLAAIFAVQAVFNVSLLGGPASGADVRG
ncbi:MAG: hypothetical protein ABI432_16530 [Flavobacteriales bacterium]